VPRNPNPASSLSRCLDSENGSQHPSKISLLVSWSPPYQDPDKVIRNPGFPPEKYFFKAAREPKLSIRLTSPVTRNPLGIRTGEERNDNLRSGIQVLPIWALLVKDTLMPKGTMGWTVMPFNFVLEEERG
jgi:hypothetical protein